MLHRICQELTRDNVADFLFLCELKIAPSRRDQIKDPRDLLRVLEQLKVVAPDNLHFLSSTLTTIRRQDLAQKVDEHHESHGNQNLRDDNIIWHNSDSEKAQVTPSSVNTLITDIWQESTNEVVSYDRARVLEPDDAEPISQHTSVSDWHETRNFQGQHVMHDVLHNFQGHHVLQTNDDGIPYNYGEQLTPPRCAASNSDEDMPCYAMNKKPRGEFYAAVFKLLFIAYCCCWLIFLCDYHASLK